MSRVMASAGVVLALFAVTGCNDVFGLDPVSLRNMAEAGAGGGDAGAPVVCPGDGAFDSGLLLNGGFESEEPDQAWKSSNVIGWSIPTSDPCEGARFLRVLGWYPDKGEVHNVVTAMPFVDAPCVDYSFWARAPTGDVTYRMTIVFNAEGPTDHEHDALSPPEGFFASSATWTRVAGRCRARVPDKIQGFSRLEIGSAKDQRVDIDALAVFAVACTGEDVDCPVPP